MKPTAGFVAFVSQTIQRELCVFPWARFKLSNVDLEIHHYPLWESTDCFWVGSKWGSFGSNMSTRKFVGCWMKWANDLGADVHGILGGPSIWIPWIFSHSVANLEQAWKAKVWSFRFSQKVANIKISSKRFVVFFWGYQRLTMIFQAMSIQCFDDLAGRSGRWWWWLRHPGSGGFQLVMGVPQHGWFLSWKILVI